MALSRWELTEPELRVRQAAATGQLVDLVGESEHIEPAHGATWPAARTVRASVLMKLLTRVVSGNGASPRGVRLRGARISGVLDLRSATLTCPLVLEGCYFDEPINLREAEALTVRLPGCHIPGLIAAQLHVAGNLELNSGFTAKGTVWLAGARIGGQLNCEGASLTNSNGRALDAYQLTVGRNVYLRKGFTAIGEVHLSGAKIGGQFNCDGAILSNPNGRALDAYQLTVGRDVYFREGFTAEGEVHLSGSQITGALNCSGGHFTNHRPDGRALTAHLLTVGQSAYFREGFTAEGEVNLSGARIGGQLNCNGASLDNRNSTEPALNAAGMIVDKDMHCQKDMDSPKAFIAKGEVRLTGARIGGQLNCDGATLTNHNGRALNAYRLSVGQDAYFRNGFAAVGEVHLSGATITGSLGCSGGNFTNHNPDGSAIGANALTVGQDVNFREGFTADGEVNLVSAQIGGQLNCDGAILTNPRGRALNAYRLTVGRDVFCKDGFRAEGEVHLNGAQIGGSLNCSGGSFTNRNPGGRAISAFGLTVVDVYCKSGTTSDGERAFTAVGEVHLGGARINGSLNCSGGHFTNPDGRALGAYSITVAQDVYFREGFTADGEINLVRGRISGELNCDGAILTNPNGRALNAYRLTVGQDVFCKDGFRAEGEVHLNSAQIAGSLNCSRGSFINRSRDNVFNHNRDRRAIDAYAITVGQNVSFQKGFTAEGEVHLAGGRIGGQVNCSNGCFSNKEGVALNLAWASATALILRPKESPDGAIKLNNATLGSLEDDPKTWPNDLYLHGFVYDSLKNDVAVKVRCPFLGRDPDGYSPQPYEQLAAVYRRAGEPESARKVLIAKQKARRKALPRYAWHSKAWSLMLGILVGHGYRTGFAAIWLLGSVAVGWWVFDLAHPAHLIASKPPRERPLFHAGLYTLDLLLPIGDLNYQGAWIARGWARACWLAWIVWGWVLTTVVIAGLAGLGKRD